MNENNVRTTVGLPLPRGEETETWVVDLTDPKLLRRTYVTHQAPYRYSPAGQIVRLSMPPSGKARVEPLLKAMTRLIERMRASGDLPQVFDADTYSHRECAEVVLAVAFIEQGTPFCTYRIEPSGRTWFCYRMHLQVSWHLDKPKPVGHPTVEPWRLARGEA